MSALARIAPALALALFAPSLALAQAYRHPSTCQDGCMTVSAYRDHGGRTDWNCGGTTYSGHGGTDFATYGSWAAVDEGRAVVAAAEGTVVQAHDGEFDRCTTGSCSGGGGFGNYVAIQHPDGVVTYYGHQRVGSIAVSVGQYVTCGQHLGFIASSGSSTGPHLHFEPRAPSGFEPFGFGGCSDPSTRWIDQGPYRGLPATACPVTDRLPEGWIDAAACDGIRGWALDPDDGGPIDVHVYIDGAAGDPAAVGYPIRAGIHRDDVGDHGWSLAVPQGFMDSRDHVVFAYGIGAGGGANAQLSGVPAVLHCDPPASPFPDGVRRHVTGPASLDAWHFDVHDIIHIDDATLERYPLSSTWPDAPQLIGADGDPGVYLRDLQEGSATRRHVPSPEAMDRWRLDWGAIAHIDPGELASLESTGAISTRPYLVQASGPALWVIDAPPPRRDAGVVAEDAGSSFADASVWDDASVMADAAARSDGGVSPRDGGPTRDGRALTAGCGCTVGSRGPSGGWLALLVVVGLRVRRKIGPSGTPAGRKIGPSGTPVGKKSGEA